MTLSRFVNMISRRKKIIADAPSNLCRYLKLWDLLSIAIGGTLGIGVFVIPGEVARKNAGPAAVVSITIAALVNFIACVCFTEFAVRIPCAGSAYIYSYVTIGEFVAFMVGWTQTFEFVLAVASLARGLSTHIDAMVDGAISYELAKLLPMNIPFLSAFPDFLAFVVLVVMHGVLLTGTRMTMLLLNALTVVSVVLIVALVYLGFTYADPANWSLPPPSISEYVPLRQVVDPGPGAGGFMPFGVRGVMQGAAQVFFGMVGINNAIGMSEETVNPDRNIPIAVIVSTVFIYAVYMCVGIGLTMMVPYYHLNPTTPYLSLLKHIGLWEWRWVVTAAAVFSLMACLLSAVIGLPRMVYAIAHDGLIFSSLQKVHKRTRVPHISIMVCCIFSGLMTLFFDLYQLAGLMSLVCLMAYTVVAICVILLRYRSEDSSSISFDTIQSLPVHYFWNQMFNTQKLTMPTKMSYMWVKISLTIYMVTCVLVCLWDTIAWDLYSSHLGWCLVVTASLLLLLTLCIIPICYQPEVSTELVFKVYLLPFVPCLAIFCNIYLMSQMLLGVWIELLIVATLGYVFYFMYGIRNSILGENPTTLAVSSSSMLLRT